ncbi:hypothetical protein [Paenibacillus sp. NEAU-GSW1]|uniref:hypothetical protein n=1 Tax=Paenibacillus sp. NEAU-GSW1 TaxID=2682486 RepID=UPI0012E27B4F|nr:hypothetical protein [Paenibacillus sp. NEAU-GSW1]MUT66626.1 hypothetical protein [Paenibacillus sp. NEAU-GSW1]
MGGKKRLLLIIISILTILISGSYLSREVFDFSFLGIEIGSELQTVRIWSYWSIGIACVPAAAYFLAIKIRDALLLLSLALQFILQLLAFSGWVFVGLLGVFSGWVSALLHAALLVLIARIATLGMEQRQGESDPDGRFI